MFFVLILTLDSPLWCTPFIFESIFKGFYTFIISLIILPSLLVPLFFFSNLHKMNSIIL